MEPAVLRARSTGRTTRFRAVWLAAAAWVLCGAVAWAGTVDTLIGGPSLDSSNNWNAGTPASSNDALISTGYPTSAAVFTFTDNETFGTLDDTNSKLITIGNTGGSDDTLKLDGDSDSVSGSAASDLIYVGSTANLTIEPTVSGSNVLSLDLNSSGNFDVAGTLAVSAEIDGHAMTKTGSGALALSNNANTFDSLTVSAGTVSGTSQGVFCGNPNNFSATAITLNGGGIQATGDLTFTNGNRGITIGTSGGTIDTNGYTITSNAVAGSSNGVLNVFGSGTLVLGSTSTYGGGTAIAAGVVQANSSTTALGTGITTINGGVLAGTGKTGGPVVVKSGGTITAGSGATTSDSIGTLNTGTQTWDAGGKYVVKIDGTSETARSAVNAAAQSQSGSADELVMGGIIFNAALDFSTTAIGGTTAFHAGSTYSWVIANNTTASTNNSFTALVGTLTPANSNLPAGSYSFSDLLASGSGAHGDDLVLSYTDSAPEPTSLLLLGAGISPLLLGRRPRKMLESGLTFRSLLRYTSPKL